jgi:glutamyl-tRNA synthetase
VAPATFDETVVSKKWNDDAVKFLSAYISVLNDLTVWNASVANSTVEIVSAQIGIGAGNIMQAFRVSITGSASGPDLMITLEILGKEEVISRITYALQTLKVNVAP